MNRVFDVYDDNGLLLQRQGLDRALPEWVKEASYPEGVPDDLFALVLPSPVSLRKYARDSRANTLLSVLYFKDTSSQLGPQLEKKAARRLVEACDWYDLRAPADLLKKADLNGTDLLPYSHQPKADVQKTLDKATGLQAVRTDANKMVGSEKGASSVEFLRQKQASGFWADPDRQRYPINSFDDVVTANSYFEKYASEFDPVTRRVMATNIYRRSKTLGIPVSKKVASEAMRKLASPESVRAHLFARATFYGRQSEGGRMFEALMNKAASLHPQVLMETVAQLDHRYGGNLHWGSRIPAPQDILFPKTASNESNPADYSYDFGTWKISGTDLVRLAKQSKLVDSRFDKEFAEAFRQDPTGFFDHLPRPEKEVLARMARDLDSPGSNV